MSVSEVDRSLIEVMNHKGHVDIIFGAALMLPFMFSSFGVMFELADSIGEQLGPKTRDMLLFIGLVVFNVVVAYFWKIKALNVAHIKLSLIVYLMGSTYATAFLCTYLFDDSIGMLMGSVAPLVLCAYKAKGHQATEKALSLDAMAFINN